MESNEDTRDVKFYPVGFVPRNSPTQTHDQIATTLASCISKPGFLHFPSWIPAFPILTWPLQAWKMHQPLQSLIWKSKFWNFCLMGEKFSLRTQTWWNYLMARLRIYILETTFNEDLILQDNLASDFCFHTESRVAKEDSDLADFVCTARLSERVGAPRVWLLVKNPGAYMGFIMQGGFFCQLPCANHSFIQDIETMEGV